MLPVTQALKLARWDRIVYPGRRDVAQIYFVVNRNRLIGPIFSFSARGTF